ncbi:DUF3027 domain-containing protein [Arthrobacter sp. LAPM80]|uniref:DUF3027 domain-containing protein n=1 Tax=Arthrobacter sp. LAPM80 TaxID=3141788 RepID=UPI00398ADB2F
MTDLSGDTTAPSTAAATEVADEQRPGVPVWRVGKPDAFLAAEVDPARNAVRSIAKNEDIGRHLGARSEGIRCVTHLFESKKAGYQGWVWFATLARVSRGKEATVNEVGLLPTEDSVLAPAWVPWSERVRPEDQQESDGAVAVRELQAQEHLDHEEDTHEEADGEDADGFSDDSDDAPTDGVEESAGADSAEFY